MKIRGMLGRKMYYPTELLYGNGNIDSVLEICRLASGSIPQVANREMIKVSIGTYIEALTLSMITMSTKIRPYALHREFFNLNLNMG